MPSVGGSHWEALSFMHAAERQAIRAAGGASSLIRNAGFKEVGRCSTVRDLLSDVQVMLSKMVCAGTHLDPTRIPAQDRDIHLVELKFCPDTNPLQGLQGLQGNIT
eukprot:1161018-Pelagomonas_calceolata.AAC.5